MSGMVPFERALVSSYRPSIVPFPLSLRIFIEIDAFVLHHVRHFFPTPPVVSAKFSHVALEVGGWPFGYEERR